MPRLLFRAFVAANVAALVAVGSWYRVTSPGFAPRPDGDEAWIAVQAGELVEGRMARTPTGNPINPFLAPTHLPLRSWLGPSAASLRAPAACCGLLAIAATFFLMGRALDPTTAAIAAVLVAVLPMAIVNSRIGFDNCQVPIAGAVALSFAFRGRAIGMLLAIAAGFLIHPTSVFAAPAVLAVHATRCLRRTPGGRPASASPGRRWLRAALPAVVLAITAVPVAQRRAEALSGDWRDAGTDRAGAVAPLSYAGGLGGLLLGVTDGYILDHPRAAPGGPAPAAIGLLAALIAAAGAHRLARDRQWERLALGIGVLVGVAGFYASAREHEVVAMTLRYHAFLIVPGATALACLARAALVDPGGGRRDATRALQWLVLLGAAWALLDCCRVGFFAACERRSEGPESIWTYRAESIDPLWEAIRLLLSDRDRLDASGATGIARVIVADDWWTLWPSRYLASGRGGPRVVAYVALGDGPEARRLALRDLIDRGAHAIGFVGGGLDAAASAIPGSEGFRRWYAQAGDSPCVVVYRRRSPAEPELLRRSLAGDSGVFEALGAAEDLRRRLGDAEGTVAVLARIVSDPGAPRFARDRALGLLEAFGPEALGDLPALGVVPGDPDLASRAAALRDRLASRSAAEGPGPAR